MMRAAAAWLVLLCTAAAAQTPPETHDQVMDRLFGMLKVAPDEEAAGLVEGAIHNQWVAAATPAVKLLLLRGLREVGDGQGQEALDDFDAALDLQPDLVEAWRGRAMARFRLGDIKGAEHDSEETMRRDPRQFETLQDLSHIAEQAGDWKGAYAAWSRLMEINPMTPGGADRLKDLHRRAFGDET